MKKSFQKSLIAASVGAVMFAAAGTASANSLLFPYFNTNTLAGAQSVLSIASNANAAPLESLHYVYNYGTACTHFDGFGSMTPNDLLQHSVASVPAGGFGKAVGSDASTPFYFPLNAPGLNFGFMVVSSKTSTAADVITGDMAIIDPSTGLVVSYAGISNRLATNGPAIPNEGNYAAITDSNFNLTTYSTTLVDTSWFTLVIGDMSPPINAGTAWLGSASLSNNNFVFDNDERPLSGNVAVRITCSQTLFPANFANAAQAAAVGVNGGMIHMTSSGYTTPPGGGTATGLVMSKIQTVKAPAGPTFAGKTFLHREPVAQ